MTRPKSAKIYIRSADRITEFMWANVTNDGTVLLGFPWESTQSVELVMNDVGNLSPSDIVTKDVFGKPKISFHPSGQFKLSALMGKSEESVDRVTVMGPKLAEISGPERIVEILIPKQLPTTTSVPTEQDIVLDATSAPNQPLRCTISCVALENLPGVLNNNRSFVNTSLWEFVHALQNETHAWVWTLRASRLDNAYSPNIKVALLGPVKWGMEKTVAL
jgi:hypothetical protein